MKRICAKSWLKLAVAGAVCYPVHASADTEDGFVGLEEIIVTAQRRSESLQDVPVSVQAVSANALDHRAITDIYQLSLAAPGLQTGGDETFAIRGAGTLAFQGTLDASVAVAVDEVNLGRRFLIGPAFNDIDRIEVLNGPQGLLFGKNASAGLINITTKRPQLNEVAGAIDLQYSVRDSHPGDDTSILARAVYNTPLTESSALRVNAHYTVEDPMTHHVKIVDGASVDDTKKDYGIKFKYLNEIDDRLTLYLIADVNKESGGYDRSYRELASVSNWTERLQSDGISPGKENFSVAANSDSYRDVELGGVSAKVTYEMSNGMALSNILAWRYYEQDQNLPDWSTARALDTNSTQSKYRQISNEIRLEIPESERVNGQVGLYFFDLKLESDIFFAGDGGLPGFLLPNFPFCVQTTDPTCSSLQINNDYFIGSDTVYTLETQSIAVFGQFDVNVTDQLKLIAGARYTYDDLSLDLEKFQRYSFFTGIGAPAVVDSTDSDENISGKLGLQYSVKEEFMAYATIGRGYKGPGYSDAPLPGESAYIDPETVDSIEVGVKSSWFDRRLTLNVSVFDQKFEDYQVEAFDGRLGQSVLQNAASLKSRGAEITVSAKPFDSLVVNASVIFLDSTFDEFEGAPCYPGQPDPSCAETNSFDASGLTTPLAADFSGTFDATYEFTLGQTATGFLNVNYYHSDPINYAIARPSVTEMGNVDLWGVTLGARMDNGFEVSLFCKNCTDQVVPQSISIDGEDSALNNSATTIHSWGYNSVRNIGIKFNYEF